ncbi:MAG: hypothetical protein WCN27_00475 [Alphaproteobacteria bacterium]
MQKLALFVDCKLKTVAYSLVAEDTVGFAQRVLVEPQLNVTENRGEHPKNMEQYSSEAENKICLEITMDSNCAEEKEI